MRQIETIVQPLMQPYQLLQENCKASAVLKEKITDIKQKIYINDQATGGFLQSLLLNPSTYPYIIFTADSKNLPYFEIQGLEAYWQQEENVDNEITLVMTKDKRSDTYHSTLPFRSQVVINMAGEWLSATILTCLE